jgi:hypothetical protein
VSGEQDVFVLYLSPKDYHRVHVPREGLARRWRYLPGTLWPVFPAAVRQIDGLFAKNERLVVHCETTDGALQVVLVGAFGVGRITASVAPIVTNVGDGPQGGVCSPPQPDSITSTSCSRQLSAPSCLVARCYRTDSLAMVECAMHSASPFPPSSDASVLAATLQSAHPTQPNSYFGRSTIPRLIC